MWDWKVLIWLFKEFSREWKKGGHGIAEEDIRRRYG